MSGTTKVKTWNKTKVQGLVRHKSGTYYARLFIGGKEKWRSLKTPLLEIAKARMGTDEAVKAIRVAKANKEEAKSGKLTVGAAVQLYKDSLAPLGDQGKHAPVLALELGFPFERLA